MGRHTINSWVFLFCFLIVPAGTFFLFFWRENCPDNFYLMLVYTMLCHQDEVTCTKFPFLIRNQCMEVCYFFHEDILPLLSFGCFGFCFLDALAGVV